MYKNKLDAFFMPKRKALYNQYKLTSELHEVANQYMDVFEKHDTLFQPLAAPSIRILAALDLRGLTPVFNTEVEAKAIRVPITENHRAMIKSTNGPDVMKTIENSLIAQIIISTQAMPSSKGLSQKPKLASWVEKPPLATVDMAWQTASNRLMPPIQ